MINYSLVGKRIEETRKLRKISQAELAERTNLSVSYISFIETAKKKASLQSLVPIADVMMIAVDSLLSGNFITEHNEYNNDIVLLMEDCISYEKRVILEQMLSLKSSLRDNLCAKRSVDVFTNRRNSGNLGRCARSNA